MHLLLRRNIFQRIHDIFHVAQVQLAAHILVLFTHFRHALLDPRIRVGTIAILLGILTHVFGNLHAAKLGSAHAAKMTRLARLAIERFVVKGTRRDGIKREIELIIPTKFKTRLA
jgi:hypothetical protein